VAEGVCGVLVKLRLAADRRNPGAGDRTLPTGLTEAVGGGGPRPTGSPGDTWFSIPPLRSPAKGCLNDRQPVRRSADRSAQRTGIGCAARRARSRRAGSRGSGRGAAPAGTPEDRRKPGRAGEEVVYLPGRVRRTRE